MPSRISSIVLTAALALAIYAAWIVFQDWGVIAAGMESIGLAPVIAVLVLSLVNYGLRYLRWNWITGIRDSWSKPENIHCYLSGFAFITTPGKAGELIRCRYYRAFHDFGFEKTTSTILTERVLDLISGLLLASLAISASQQYGQLGLFATAVVVTLLIFAKSDKLIAELTYKVASHFEDGLVTKLLKSVRTITDIFNAQTGLRVIILGTVIGLLSWSAEAIGFAWLARLVGSEASYSVLMGIFALSLIAGALSFLPGGLGGTEAVMLLLLMATGLGSGESTVVVLVSRLCTLWFAVVIGVFSIHWLEQRTEQALNAKQSTR